MSRNAFPALEREYNEREERLDVARASRRLFEQEIAAKRRELDAEARAEIRATSKPEGGA